ncbi:hypothetical protein AUP68_04980 [Ilyonectria robusta]
MSLPLRTRIVSSSLPRMTLARCNVCEVPDWSENSSLSERTTCMLITAKHPEIPDGVDHRLTCLRWKDGTNNLATKAITRRSNIRRLQARVRELEAAQNLEPGALPHQRQSSSDLELPRTEQQESGNVGLQQLAENPSVMAPVKDNGGRETMVAENTGELRYFGV